MAILSKIKEKIKKVINFKNKLSLKQPLSNKTGRNKSNQEIEKGLSRKKDFISSQETVIENAKFSYPETFQFRRPTPQELPHKYDQDRMILQVRDPRWLHTYWEVRDSTYQKLINELKDDFYKAKRILRAYDVTNIIFNGSNSRSFFDIEINDYASNWYIDINNPGTSWCVDLGLLLPDGRFITILRSNVVYMPLDGPSWITDEEWLIPEDMFARLYGMGFGLGQSSPVGKAWQERVKHVLSSGAISSASPVKKMVKGRKFWMELDCELIVYGATEPDARVTLNDKQIQLRPDGTFTIRFALPDSRQAISIKAVSSDNIEERIITPIITRDTKRTISVKE